MSDPNQKISPAALLAKQLNGNDEGDDKIVLSCKLKALREEIGLSQSVVAQATATSPQSIGAAERGSAIRLDLALRLAAFFGRSVEAIWALPLPEAKTPPPADKGAGQKAT